MLYSLELSQRKKLKKIIIDAMLHFNFLNKYYFEMNFFLFNFIRLKLRLLKVKKKLV